MINISLVTMHDMDISVGLGYLISYYRKYGRFNKNIRFKIIGCKRIFNRPVESKFSILRKIKGSDIVGFSTVTQDYNLILEIAKNVKQYYNIPIIFGGPHVSILPHTLPKFVDIGVVGEGEDVFKELIDNYKLYNNFDSSWLANIPGIVFHRNGSVIINNIRPLIEPLDSIPMPARDIFSRRYWLPRLNASFYRKKGGEVLARISTSRGCPFKCIFCSASKFWRNTIRYFSAEYVACEIKFLAEKCGCDSIHINDDLFTVNIPRLTRIVELLEKDKVLKKISISFVQARADMFSEELCLLLKRLNVRTIAFGIESGSEAMLSYLKNNTVTVNKNWEAVNRAIKWGFFVWPQLIVGIPGEDSVDVEKTLEFTNIKEIKRYQITMLAPYPGTEVWDHAVKRNLVSESMDFKRLALDIKEKELKNKVYLGDKMAIGQLWDLIKEPFKKEEYTRSLYIKFNFYKDTIDYVIKYLRALFFMLYRELYIFKRW